tara:strand:+ start:2199 stop:2402 length:204 start_codon:yes stop_codon:yes gene_type:complete
MQKVLKKKLWDHLQKYDITFQDIRKKNHFPVGRECLEKISAGKKVSDKLSDKLFEYLETFENKTNDK